MKVAKVWILALLTFASYWIAGAHAFTTEGCQWNRSVTYSKDVLSSRQEAVDMAASAWSDTPIPITLIPTSDTPTADIQVIHGNYPELTSKGIPGITNYFCGENGPQRPVPIFLNDEILENPQQPYADERAYINVVAHEFGHALGLYHSNIHESVMWETLNFPQNGIYVPVWDDIMGIISLYGVYNAGKFCCTQISGAASTTGLEPPFDLNIQSASSGTYATDFTSTVLPNSGFAMMTAIVKATTLHRFSMGWLTSTNPVNETARFATVELDDDGIKLVFTRTGGPVQVNTFSCCPTNGVSYFLELVVRNEGGGFTPQATAYAYRVDTGQYLGHSDSGPTLLWRWPDVHYFEVSTWTGSADPASKYSLTEFWNWQSIGAAKTTGGGFGMQLHFSQDTEAPLSGVPVTLTAVGSGGTAPYGYLWTFGDGGAAQGNPVSHAYSLSGDYTVTLRRTDANGIVSSFSRILHIEPYNSGGSCRPRPCPVGPS